MTDDSSTPGPVGSPVDRGVGRLVPERAHPPRVTAAMWQELQDVQHRAAQRALNVELVMMRFEVRQAARTMPLAAAVLQLSDWLERMREEAGDPPSFAVRWAASYWREQERAEDEFRRAFPNWKTPNVLVRRGQGPGTAGEDN